jgi:hypothetical protein
MGTDGRTDGHDDASLFRDFANAPKVTPTCRSKSLNVLRIFRKMNLFSLSVREISQTDFVSGMHSSVDGGGKYGYHLTGKFCSDR